MFVKMSVDIIDRHIANIVKDISDYKYSENPKTANVRPTFKIGDRTKIKNYRLVNLLNVFSNMNERFLHENLTRYVHMFFSKFTSAHRKSYNSNHVPLRLIESCKKSLDQKMFVGAVPMDLSKAFDSMLHGLIVKMHTYGFSKNSLVFFYSYLKRRRKKV